MPIYSIASIASQLMRLQPLHWGCLELRLVCGNFVYQGSGTTLGCLGLPGDTWATCGNVKSWSGPSGATWLWLGIRGASSGDSGGRDSYLSGSKNASQCCVFVYERFRTITCWCQSRRCRYLPGLRELPGLLSPVGLARTPRALQAGLATQHVT